MKTCEGESFPIYVVCNGDNFESTVLLGAFQSDQELMTTKVNVIGYFPKNHEALTIVNMENNHMMNARTKNCVVITQKN